MLNDRDDRYEEHDDGEYHFSDDDTSYEVENDGAKETPPAGQGGPKENLLSRLSRSKRMLIGLAVFFVLVSVVYKMVMPSSTTPATNIEPVKPMVAQQATPVSAMPTPQAAPAPMTMPQTPAPAPATQIATNQTMPAPVANVPQTAAMPPAPTGPAMVGNQTMATTPAAPMAMPQPSAGNMPAPVAGQPATPAVASMPPVIPVQAPTPPSYAIAQQNPELRAPGSQMIDSQAQQLAQQGEQLSRQMQADYSQRMASFVNENQALQTEVQTLNTRVAEMESQLQQILQAVSKQGQAAPVNNTGTGAEPAKESSPAAKIAYSVQAIIPGRAWLKSESGETLTVAEGDMLKDIGRVTKIDPYDGVVEIDTGSKTISLSYGNGG